MMKFDPKYFVNVSASKQPLDPGWEYWVVLDDHEGYYGQDRIVGVYTINGSLREVETKPVRDGNSVFYVVPAQPKQLVIKRVIRQVAAVYNPPGAEG
jgi:hypothetical protein